MLKSKKLIWMVLMIFVVLATTFVATERADAATYTGKYWLKVNEQANVVTAYYRTNGKWVPIRAMLCSTGVNNSTPKGTFYTKGKWNWGALYYGVYGQYCTHITQDILFHSVGYAKQYGYASQSTSAFNKLGKTASHGCIRLSTMDAKWVYDKCKVGTRVTVYRSSQPGPLGKPVGNKAKAGRKSYWDPTDPNKKNPFFTMRKPVINISDKKKSVVEKGSSYSLKWGVTAKDPNTFMNLSSYVKVKSVTIYSTENQAYLPANFSTESAGEYRVTYYVKDPYGRAATKTFDISVVDGMQKTKFLLQIKGVIKLPYMTVS